MNLSDAIVGVVEKVGETLVFAKEILLTITIASSTRFNEQGQKVREKPQ